MRIRRLDVFGLSVPLRQPFRTASAERTASDNLVVRAELAGGSVGYGEGLPRDYITGETIDSCFDYLSGLVPTLSSWDFPDFDSLVEMLWDLSEQAQDGPPSFAARCALELALLDAGMRHWGKSFGDIFTALPDVRELHQPSQSIRYSVVASLDSPKRTWRKALKFRLYGFKQVKVKVGNDVEADEANLKTLRRFLSRAVELRVDANGVWLFDEAISRIRKLADFGVVSVEQPLSRTDSVKLSELRTRINVPIVLDESFVSTRDAMLAIDGKWGDVFNLRLSKCGGFLACLKLADMARRAGLKCQLGCHPGETAILSAAGRHFATCVGGLTALEGSYDRHILKTNVIDGDITFGFGGKAPALPGPGLGISVNPLKLKTLTTRRQTLEIH